MSAAAHSYPRSMLTLMSPATCTCALSMGLNPARSSISLAASSCTCSDLAPVARLITLAAAAVAFNPSCSVTRCIIYCCTCGKRIVRDALTLPDSPSAYPASLAASRNVQPVATRVSTKAVCFGVNLRCSMLICVSPLAPLSLSPPTHSIVNEGGVNAQYGRSPPSSGPCCRESSPFGSIPFGLPSLSQGEHCAVPPLRPPISQG